MRSVGFQPVGQFEFLAEVLEGFIGREAGWVGGYLEQGAAWFAEVDGVEILPVAHGSDPIPLLGEGGLPRQLLGVIGRAEGDVVDRTCAHAPSAEFGPRHHIYQLAEVARACVAATAVFFAQQLVAKAVGQQGGRGFGRAHPEGDAVEAAQGVCGGDVAGGGWGGRGRVYVCFLPHQFQHHAIGVAKGEEGLAKAGFFAKGDLMSSQPLAPKVEGRVGDAVGHGRDFARAAHPASRHWPWEKCQNGARLARVIAIVEVIGSGVVKIDCQFDKPLAENLGVKIHIALGVARKSGDVV